MGSTVRERCLICFDLSSCSSKDLKLEVSSSTLLKEQLSVFYLVNKILEVPSEECEKYLQIYGNPANWVKLCIACTSVVQEAETIRDKINQLQSQLNKIKIKLKCQMKVKVEGQTSSHFLDSENALDTAADQIRSFICNNDEIQDERLCFEEMGEEIMPQKTSIVQSSFSSYRNMEEDVNEMSIKLENYDEFMQTDESESDIKDQFCPSPQLPQIPDLNDLAAHDDIDAELTDVLAFVNQDFHFPSIEPVESTPITSKKRKGKRRNKLTLRKKNSKSQARHKKLSDLKAISKIPKQTLSNRKAKQRKLLSELSEDSDWQNDVDNSCDSESSFDDFSSTSNTDDNTEDNSDDEPVRKQPTIRKTKAIYTKRPMPKKVQNEKQNLQKNKTIESKEFPCVECDQVFSGSSALRKHVRTHKVGFRCEYCNIVNAYNLEHHLRSQHLPNSVSTCSGCDQVIKNYYDYNKHLKTSPNPLCMQSSIKCPKCKTYRAGNQEALDVHMKHRHLDKSLPFICPVETCKKSFYCKSKLAMHQESKHSGDGRKYSCDKCGANFTLMDYLKRHIREIHVNRGPDGKKFPCSTCGKIFNTSSKQKRHEVIHKDDRPFLCTVCGKSFKLLDSVNIHMWSHDPERKTKYPAYMPKATKSSRKEKTIEIPIPEAQPVPAQYSQAPSTSAKIDVTPQFPSFPLQPQFISNETLHFYNQMESANFAVL